MTYRTDTDLKSKADSLRKEVLRVCVRNGAGHIAPSLSCVDILVALYYAVMQIRPDEPKWAERDRLIFSKAHGAYALYAILADIGIIPRDQWEGYYTEKSSLAGCLERNTNYGIEAGCGSLGHGLPIAVGSAFAGKYFKESYFTFCITGDGELQEGTTWEALQFAVKHKLDNFCLIVDQNRLQAMDHIVNVLDQDNLALARKLAGFDVEVINANGHDAPQLAQVLMDIRTKRTGKPCVVLADTVKGYGVPCMEDLAKFHFRIPTEEELNNDA